MFPMKRAVPFRLRTSDKRALFGFDFRTDSHKPLIALISTNRDVYNQDIVINIGENSCHSLALAWRGGESP